MRTEIVFIGGRSGTGKSSVGLEMHAQLSAAGVTHCLIEGDFLDMAFPAPWKHHLAERNLTAIWANYLELDYHRVVYTNTVCILPDLIEALSTAIGGDPKVSAVLLTCTDATARERLSRREIGTAFDRHLASSIAMDAQLREGAGATVHRLPTDARAVPDIAADIIAITGWRSAHQGET